MPRRSLPLVLTLLLATAGVAVPPGRALAAQPLVTLTVENATLEDTLAALSKATGIPMQAITTGEDPTPQIATLAWKDTPLPQVFADLAATYGVLPAEPRAGGYRLLRGRLPFMPEAAAARKGVPFSLEDVRLEVTDQYQSRQGEADRLVGTTARLRCQVDAADPDEFSRDAWVTAVDDAGQVYEAPLGSVNPWRAAMRGDRWNLTADFGWLRPGVRHLRAVDVVVPKDRTLARREEFSWPLDQQNSLRKVGPVTLEVVAAGKVPEAEREALRAWDGDFMVQTLVRWEPGLRVEAPGRRSVVVPILQGVSGRYYWPRREWDLLARANAADRTQSVALYEMPPEPLARLIYRYLEVRPTEDATLFQLGRVEVPVAGARNRAYNPERYGPPPTEWKPRLPFLAPEGGVLTVTGLPAAERLLIGVRRKEAEGWSGLRWLQIVPDEHGTARLGPLAAGTYRIEVLPATGKRESAPPREVVVRGGEEVRLAGGQ